jgi:hypothetical protein
VNAPDWIPARSTATKRNPAARTAAASRSDLRRDRTRQVVLEQLDSSDVAVVPHPAVGEAEGPHGVLGRLDLGQLGRIDLGEVRYA